MSIVEDIEIFFEQHVNGYFLVDIKASAADRIMVLVDNLKGITIDECSALHRKLVESIEMAGDYEITVSSPGLDEPFKVADQYVKNIGKEVSVITNEGQKLQGKLSAYETETIKIEEHQKTETKLHLVNLSNIKSTKLSLSFKNHKK